MSSASNAKSHGHWSKKQTQGTPKNRAAQIYAALSPKVYGSSWKWFKWFLSWDGSFPTWPAFTSELLIAVLLIQSAKGTKTKTLEKQQTQRKGHDFMPNSCDIDPSKVPIFPSKTCLPRYWSLHRRQAVDHPSCVVATGCPWGFGHLTGHFCGILMWKTIENRYFITCKNIYIYIFILLLNIVQSWFGPLNHWYEIDSWTKANTLACDECHPDSLYYQLLHMLEDNTTRRACKNTPVLPRITVNICTDDHKRTSIQGNGCTHVREVWTCEQHYL